MSEHNKKMTISWFEEVWNQERQEATDELLPSNCLIHEGRSSAKGPAKLKPFFDRMRAAFSDIHVTCHETIAEGDLVCLRWSVTMPHTGDGLGMKATGKQLQSTGLSMVRFANGRFAEAWQNWAMLRPLQQTGATEPSPVNTPTT